MLSVEWGYLPVRHSGYGYLAEDVAAVEVYPWIETQATTVVKM